MPQDERIGVDEADNEDAGTETGTDEITEVDVGVGITELAAAALPDLHAVQTVDVDVNVSVERVLYTDVTALPPE